MAEVIAQVEIRVWDRLVGALIELDSGPILFEYAAEFRRSGLELSPFHLPLSLAGPVRFDELRSRPAFAGLPGVLADSLPDAFGNKVIRAYLATRGQEAGLTPAQRLLYVGSRGIGALTYHPARELEARVAEREALELALLVRDARRVVEGEATVAIPEIYRIGSSAGGMRPKAVVLFNQASGEIRSAFATPGPGDVPSILKFDGVGDGSTTERLGMPLSFNRIEAAYTEMARRARIATADVQIVDEAGYAHLMIRRFDVTAEGDRLHQHSFGGLIHVDYNEPGASSYEEYLRSILRLGMPYASLEEGYRRAVFNVLAVNQDDHVKNLSFLMDRAGEWSLSPAYDLTFARGTGWTARHQMQVRGRTSGITRGHLLELADEVSVTKAGRVIDEVRGAVAAWPEFARAVQVPEPDIARVGGELARRDAEVFG